MMLDTSDNSRSPLLANLRKPAPYKSALAERLARIKAQAAAQQAQEDAQQAQQQPVPRDSSTPPPARRVAAPDSADKPKDSTQR
jgi:hypothetical protein